MNPMGFLLCKCKHKHAGRLSLHASSSPFLWSPLLLCTEHRHCPLPCTQPLPISWPCLPTRVVPFQCPNPGAFCSCSSSTLAATLHPTPHHPVSGELRLVAVGSGFVIRYKLTFKEKNHRSNHCNAIDLLGTEPGRCLTFCIIIYGRGRSRAVFSHKKCIYFCVQSTYFAMGPKTVLIH